jgi:spoIIIJ-associated protein
VRVSLPEDGEDFSCFSKYNSGEDFSESAVSSDKDKDQLSETSLKHTQEVLLNLLRLMGYSSAKIEVLNGSFVMPGEDANVSTVFNIRGENLGALIGHKNQTLIALQYLVRLMVNNSENDCAAVIIDVNGCRQKRYRELKNLALRMADQVVAKKMPFALEPMSAFDRRIVHMVLSEHPQVTTQSVGMGESRKIIVLLR